MFPDFIFFQRGEAAIWVDPGCSEPTFVERLTDADGLLAQPDCQIIKDQKKITIGRLTLSIAGRSRTIFVKRYNAFSLRYRLASPFTYSGAFRSLRGAAILRAAEIPCARPIAAVENRKGGALTKSFFLAEEVAGGETVDAHWRNRLQGLTGHGSIALRRHFLAQLACLFNTLHGESIYHNDLKDANILAVSDGCHNDLRFVLLDLDGVTRLGRLSRRRRVKNLMQLNRTLGRYLRRPEKMFFLKCYLGSTFSERSQRRELTERVLSESSRVDRLMADRD